MAKKVNLKTIASDLSLYPGKVLRVLNGKAKQFYMIDETVEKELDYIKQKKYSPNLITKGFHALKTFTIGLVIPYISNLFFALLAKHIEKAASKANYSILLVDAEENFEREKNQDKNMLTRQFDGIITDRRLKLRANSWI